MQKNKNGELSLSQKIGIFLRERGIKETVEVVLAKLFFPVFKFLKSLIPTWGKGDPDVIKQFGFWCFYREWEIEETNC